MLPMSAHSPLLHVLEDRIPWFGRYNGYEQLWRYLPGDQEFRLIRPQPGWLPRLRGKWFSLRHGLGPGQQSHADAASRLARALERSTAAVGHVLYGEHFLRFLGRLPARVLQRCAVTLHQPRAHWKAADLEVLRRIPHRIFLFSPAPGSFEPHPEGSTSVLLHGVDTDFFAPADLASHPPRILYSGVHLRNLAMLERVVERLLAGHRELVVDMLVPVAQRQREEFLRLSRHQRVVWHAGLDEHRLLALYRHSTAMLLPMQDSGANTAVVEALSCGLPVVTTDVGGIRDYGGGAHYPVVANDDDDAMLALLHRLLGEPQYRAAAAKSARALALSRLDWRLVARQHVAAYGALQCNGGH
jgi:glycosyltransferase involved in cell wall biosynthesis